MHYAYGVILVEIRIEFDGEVSTIVQVRNMPRKPLRCSTEMKRDADYYVHDVHVLPLETIRTATWCDLYG